MSDEGTPQKPLSAEVRKIDSGELPDESILFKKHSWEDSLKDIESAESWYRVFERTFAQFGIEVKNAKVLELGSGNSMFLKVLQSKGIDAVGVDARPRGETEGLPVIAARIEQLPFPNETFTLVVSTAIFDNAVYAQNQERMIEEIGRVLKSGGVYVSAANFGERNTPENLELISGTERVMAVYRKK